MIEMSATVKNDHGIHCRPSTVIIKEVMGYAGEIRVTADSGACDLRSVMQLIALGLQAGSEVKIFVNGPDEEGLCRRLVELFERHFDFPPREPGEPVPPAFDAVQDG